MHLFLQFGAAVKFYDKAEAADPGGTLDGVHLMYANRAASQLELNRLNQVRQRALCVVYMRECACAQSCERP